MVSQRSWCSKVEKIEEREEKSVISTGFICTAGFVATAGCLTNSDSRNVTCTEVKLKIYRGDVLFYTQVSTIFHAIESVKATIKCLNLWFTFG
jgi:hypothetical protein